MLQVRFTGEDLLRTRFAAEPAPLQEVALAIAALQRQDALFERWRREAGARLPRVAQLLTQLIPPSGTGPNFLDQVSEGIEDGLDAVMSTPTAFVRCDLRRICADGRPITPWIRALNGRDRDAWRLLEEALRSAHAALVQPMWARIRQSVHGDVACRGRLVAESGLMAALETLHPAVRWHGTTLEIDTHVRYSVQLDGRGVTLFPSAMSSGRPMVGSNPDGSTRIIYSALTPLPLVGLPVDDALAVLLGRTRAAVLALTVTPRKTTELARELGISAASASVHARALRASGLLVTERAGKAVLHSTTPLGDRLLAEAPHLPRRADPNGRRIRQPGGPERLG